MPPIRALLVLGSLLLAACEQVPDCKVMQDHVDVASANAGCLVRLGSALLIVKQRTNGQWNIPAGSGKDNESAQCTAHRETWEESGLDVQVGRLLEVFDNNFRLYECHAVDRKLDPTQALKTPLQGRMEISAARWIRPEDIEKKHWRYARQLPTIRRLFDEMDSEIE